MNTKDNDNTNTSSLLITSPKTGEQAEIPMTTTVAHVLDGSLFLTQVQDKLDITFDKHISEEIGGDDSGGVLVVNPNEHYDAPEQDRLNIQAVFKGEGNIGNLSPKRFLELACTYMVFTMNQPNAMYTFKFSW